MYLHVILISYISTIQGHVSIPGVLHGDKKYLPPSKLHWSKYSKPNSPS